MAPKLDSQGWMDAMHRERAFALFVRDDLLWVRYNGHYKRTQLAGCSSIAAAKALASVITGESHYWMDEPAARKAGLPSE